MLYCLSRSIHTRLRVDLTANQLHFLPTSRPRPNSKMPRLKRKAEEEHEARREADKAKRQRISEAFNFGDILVAGKGGDAMTSLLNVVGPANPYERTFDEDDVKETTDKELKALREKMSGLELWTEYEPTELKITPERIVSLDPIPYRIPTDTHSTP